MLLLGTVAYAQVLPRPIAVKIISVNPAIGTAIEIRDLGLGQSVIVLSNEYGEVLEDANTLFPNYRDNDMIQVKVLICADRPACTQQQVLGDAVYFEFNLPDILFPTTTTIATTTTTEFPIPTTTTTLPPECPVDLNDEIIIAVLVLIFASAGGVFLIKKYFVNFLKNGWGVRIYKSLDGKEVVVLHKHPGIVNYHNPDTIHKKEEIRHAKGKVF